MEALCVQTESGQGYDLDRSLFERLVRQGFPVATLEQQRRMRPSISRLIRNTIYPSLQVSPVYLLPPFRSYTPFDPFCASLQQLCIASQNHDVYGEICNAYLCPGTMLKDDLAMQRMLIYAQVLKNLRHQNLPNGSVMMQDHASVRDYPKVKGMVHNVFFWDHNHPEGGRDENASKQNSTEAAMAARLALYLTQQGYKAGDITILTPYVGQLLLLRAEVRKYMRFVVSDRDAEELAAAQVTHLGSAISLSLLLHTTRLIPLFGLWSRHLPGQ